MDKWAVAHISEKCGFSNFSITVSMIRIQPDTVYR
jgi:hypothetical protein